MDSPAPPLAPPIYKPGDKIRSDRGGQMYDAKIVKVDASRGADCYLIHYTGWNSRHDAWLPIHRLCPEQLSETRCSSKRVRDSEDALTKQPEPAKLKQPELIPQKRVKLPLPRELKQKLVADWEQITLEPRKWVPVPRVPCVRDIMHQFVESRSRDTRWRDFGDAVVLYFDKALPKILLYRHEREQFDQIVRRYTESAPSSLFGAEHLVRLFAKLPELLCRTSLSPSDLNQTKSKLTDLYKWLVKHGDRLFLSHYQLREKLLGDYETAPHSAADDQAPRLDERQQPLSNTIPTVPDEAGVAAVAAA